jgi:hypothetical protein
VTLAGACVCWRVLSMSLTVWLSNKHTAAFYWSHAGTSVLRQPVCGGAGGGGVFSALLRVCGGGGWWYYVAVKQAHHHLLLEPRGWVDQGVTRLQ